MYVFGGAPYHKASKRFPVRCYHSKMLHITYGIGDWPIVAQRPQNRSLYTLNCHLTPSGSDPRIYARALHYLNLEIRARYLFAAVTINRCMVYHRSRLHSGLQKMRYTS